MRCLRELFTLKVGNVVTEECEVALLPQMKITLAVRSNNQWKKNAFVFNSPHGACSFGRANLPGMMEASVGMDTTSRKPCLIPEVSAMSASWNEGEIHRVEILSFTARDGLARVRKPWGKPLSRVYPSQGTRGLWHQVSKATKRKSNKREGKQRREGNHASSS